MKRHQEHQVRFSRLQEFQQSKRQQLLLRAWAAWKQSRNAVATTTNTQIIEARHGRHDDDRVADAR
eukprot:5842500-Prymnesium_polylepis.1